MADDNLIPGFDKPLDDTPYENCPEVPVEELAISLNSGTFSREVSASLSKWGFLLLTDLDDDTTNLIEDVVTGAHAFFTSEEEKQNWPLNPLTEIGYVAPGSGSSLSKIADKKEYCVIKPRHPEFSLPEGGHLDKAPALIERLEEVGFQVLDAIEESCPIKAQLPYLSNLRKKGTNSPHTIMRINFMPPSSPDDPDGMMPAGKHTDVGAVTVLVPAKGDAPGLVLWDRNGKKWRVPYVPNALVINVGDVVSIASGGKVHITGQGEYGNGKVYPNGYYPSTLHGVDRVDSRKVNRITIPVFIHFHDDAIIADAKDVDMAGTDDMTADVAKAMKRRGGLTTNIFKDARLANHGIGKQIEDAYDDK